MSFEEAKRLRAAFAEGPVWILDGAMATELEARGADLKDPLWSARVLLENPALVKAVHADYFAAGADVAITASYQASFEGLAARGLDRDSAAALMVRSVSLAREARDAFLASPAAAGRRVPLVAASVGPYGASLHDGSEYSGDYGLSYDELAAWHRPRLQVLAASGADLLACETLPSQLEAEVLVDLLDEVQKPAWISLSCRDGEQTNHGESFAETAARVAASPWVVAVGANCTAPRHILSLLQRAAGVTERPLLCYPNSGEGWDAARQCWLPTSGEPDWVEAARSWVQAGARLVGGCCRTSPTTIATLRENLAPVV